MSPRLAILVLGGTAWLGREISTQALARGHAVSCLARGESGPPAAGASFIRADRRDERAYEAVRDQSWDTVIDVSWQPGMVRGALAALHERARHWIYISSGSVYASHAMLGADESAGVLAPTELDTVGTDLYGEAKVACESATRAAAAQSLLIARAGLIGGPGDTSDRAGYWVARAARDPLGPMLIPGDTGARTQVIDVRDLASWLLDCAERRVTGTYDTVGRSVPLSDWISTSRELGGHTGPVVHAEAQWLLAQGVEEFMGPQALPLWIADRGWPGFCARSGARARELGLRPRPIRETLLDTLAWERELGLERRRKSGISAAREAELIAEMKHG